jgi:hypothetical protein
MKMIPKLALLTVISMSVSRLALAQDTYNPNTPTPVPIHPYKPGDLQGPIGDPGEVSPAVDLSKLKSNNESYQSKYKPPDWYLDAFKWAQNVSQFLHPFFTPGGKSPYGTIRKPAYEDPLHEYAPETAAATPKRYYFSYGIGLALCMRGGKYVSMNGAGGSEIDGILYLQIPIIKVRFNYVLPALSTVYVEAGPYYGLALTGHYKDDTGSHGLKFGNDANTDDYRRGDFGLKCGLGYKFAYIPILVGLDGDFGLRSLIPGGDPAAKIHNQAFGLRVGYRLGFRKPS